MIEKIVIVNGKKETPWPRSFPVPNTGDIVIAEGMDAGIVTKRAFILKKGYRILYIHVESEYHDTYGDLMEAAKKQQSDD